MDRVALEMQALAALYTPLCAASTGMRFSLLFEVNTGKR